MTIELAQDIEERIRKFASQAKVSESFVVSEAVLRFLEDKDDYAAGIQALASMKYSISLNEMERRSDVAG